MSYAFRTTVSAPIELYDAVHAEVIKRTQGGPEGLLVHLGLPAAEGFQVIEVWESKAAVDRFNEELVGPILAELSQGRPGPAPEMTVDEFDLHGLIISGRHVVS